MPPRKRNKENAGLPPRWRWYHGAYRYLVPPGLEYLWNNQKQVTLGKTLSEAHRVFAEHAQGERGDLRTIGQALDRYALEVVPTKAASTQRDQLAYIKRLRGVFGDMPILVFQPHHAYGYQDRRGKQARTATNRELELLSHMFTMCFQWGVALKTHPMIEGKFRKLKTAPRDRYVEDWEILQALAVKPMRKRGSVRMCQAYVKLKLLTGFRRKDMLLLQISDLRDDGIHVRPTKTAHSSGIQSVRTWTEKLREVVQECIDARPVDISPYLFCNGRGEGYVKANGKANGFDNIWGRFMDRVVTETQVQDRFQERDLRAKCATDAKTLEHAQGLLDHASSSTTKRIYRRKPAAVEPAKGV